MPGMIALAPTGEPYLPPGQMDWDGYTAPPTTGCGGYGCTPPGPGHSYPAHTPPASPPAHTPPASPTPHTSMPTPPAPTLPVTGPKALDLALIGVCILLAGAVLVALSYHWRKCRPRPAHRAKRV